MSKKPTEKFAFNGNFSVGGIPAGEDANAIKEVSPVKAAWQPKKKQAAVEESEDEEEEDDEDEEDDMNDFANLPKEVIARIGAVRAMHTDYEKIELEYKQERIALEKKYLALKQVVIDKRQQIVCGAVDVPVEEDVSGEKEGAAEAEQSSDVKGIPGFWLTILTSHPSIGELVTEEDIPVLEKLSDVTVDYGETFQTFTITFHFEENEFFTNKTLKKVYEVSPDLLDEKAPSLAEVQGSEINWKDGQNLTITETIKKQKANKGKNKGQVKTVVTTSPKPSFFHYFGAPMTEEEEEEAQDNEDEDAVQVKLSQEEDYDIGHSIRTSLVPEAVLWYTGEAIEDDGEDDEDDEDDEGLFEDADDDDEDEDSDEEEEDTRAKQKKGKKSKGESKMTFSPEGGFAASGAPKEQAECKQN